MKASILAFLLSLAAASAFGQTAGQTAPVTPAAPSAPPAATAPPGATPSSAPTSVSAPFPASGYMTYAFKDLGAPQGLRLVEGSAEGGVTYMVRRDEVITAARLRLLLENSAGFPADTKLEVTVNGDAVGTIDVGTDRHSATPVDLPVDPILLGDYNRVGFKLLGVPLASCTANENGPWMTIGPRSAVDVTAGRLPLANDLAVLPLPFFDDRDPHALETSFVFGRTPGPAELEASGIVASWLGGMAGFRGVHLPAVFGTVPAGNAIVFAMGKDNIPGLTLPQAAGPTLAIVPNPNDPSGKLLLVMGRNADDLKVAARGLALATVPIRVARFRRLPPSRRPNASRTTRRAGSPTRTRLNSPTWRRPINCALMAFGRSRSSSISAARPIISTGSTPTSRCRCGSI